MKGFGKRRALAPPLAGGSFRVDERVLQPKLVDHLLDCRDVAGGSDRPCVPVAMRVGGSRIGPQFAERAPPADGASAVVSTCLAHDGVR